MCTGEEDRHSSLELNVHGPTVRGWQSSRRCTYPQELILRLHGPTKLTRIQVLAHQYLIRKLRCISKQSISAFSRQKLYFHSFAFIIIIIAQEEFHELSTNFWWKVYSRLFKKSNSVKNGNRISKPGEARFPRG